MPSKEYEQLVIDKTLTAKEIKEFLLGFNYVSDFYHEVELSYGFSQGARTVKAAYTFLNKYNELESSICSLQSEIDEIVYKIYTPETQIPAVFSQQLQRPPYRYRKQTGRFAQLAAEAYPAQRPSEYQA